MSSLRPDALDRLRTRWPLPTRPHVRDALLTAYAAPDRGYHDVEHLGEVLDRLDELHVALPSLGLEAVRLEVELAAWFHDAVYDDAPDPEGRSAAWAAEALAGVVAAGDQVDVTEVVRLVLLTRAHDPGPGDAAGAALCDADLAILAAPTTRYNAYVRGVRQEYAAVPDDLFARGRAEVLRGLLERPTLFTTAYARSRWEPAARENAGRELAALQRGDVDAGALSGDGASGDAGPPAGAG